MTNKVNSIYIPYTPVVNIYPMSKPKIQLANTKSKVNIIIPSHDQNGSSQNLYHHILTLGQHVCILESNNDI